MPTPQSATLRATEPSLIQLGRDLCATLLDGNLDQSLLLLLTHAEQTGHCFSEETQACLHAHMTTGHSRETI